MQLGAERRHCQRGQSREFVYFPPEYLEEKKNEIAMETLPRNLFFPFFIISLDYDKSKLVPKLDYVFLQRCIRD